MTATPINTIIEPMISNLSGFFLSTQYPQIMDMTTNIPPYVAYTRPNSAGCSVGIIPYENKINAPTRPKILPL